MYRLHCGNSQSECPSSLSSPSHCWMQMSNASPSITHCRRLSFGQWNSHDTERPSSPATARQTPQEMDVNFSSIRGTEILRFISGNHYLYYASFQVKSFGWNMTKPQALLQGMNVLALLPLLTSSG